MRVPRTQKHLLTDILVIAILTVIGGAEGWEYLETYRVDKQQWLEEVLELPNGIPSDGYFWSRGVKSSILKPSHNA